MVPNPNSSLGANRVQPIGTAYSRNKVRNKQQLRMLRPAARGGRGLVRCTWYVPVDLELFARWVPLPQRGARGRHAGILTLLEERAQSGMG